MGGTDMISAYRRDMGPLLQDSEADLLATINANPKRVQLYIPKRCILEYFRIPDLRAEVGLGCDTALEDRETPLKDRFSILSFSEDPNHFQAIDEYIAKEGEKPDLEEIKMSNDLALRIFSAGREWIESQRAVDNSERVLAEIIKECA